VKFPRSGPTRAVDQFTVGIVDGFLKILCVLGVITIVHRLLDTDLSSVLKAAEDGFNWQRINFVLEAPQQIHCNITAQTTQRKSEIKII
ncbi:unnamed protein product, partial [Durusdinium trenchii]